MAMITIREYDSGKDSKGFDFLDGESFLVSVEKMEFNEPLSKEADGIIALLKAAPALLEACKEARKNTYHLGALGIRDLLEKLLDEAIAAAEGKA